MPYDRVQVGKEIIKWGKRSRETGERKEAEREGDRKRGPERGRKREKDGRWAEPF